MNILEGNRLIAEFMGGRVVDNIFICNESTKTHNERCLHHYNISQASYNSSWDWLMPVIYNWRKLHIMRKDNPLYIDDMYELLTEDLNNALLYSDNIIPIYEQVCENIQWYNKNKQ